MMGILATMWKALSDDERKPYEKKSEEDKERVAEQLKTWVKPASSNSSSSSSDKKRKRKKAKKDKGAPKKALTAYNAFNQQNRGRIKAENPDIPHAQIFTKLGEAWKLLSADEKKPFEKLAEDDKLRFSRENTEYLATKGLNRANGESASDGKKGKTKAKVRTAGKAKAKRKESSSSSSSSGTSSKSSSASH